MIQLLFTVLIAFSCLEGSNSENKCGNVEQRTVEPPNIKCPNKPPITNPIWKPVSPQRLRSALQNADDDPSCPKKNEAPSCPPKPIDKSRGETKPSCPSNPSTNDNTPALEQKKKPTSIPCLTNSDRKAETEQKKLSSPGSCDIIPKVKPECPTSPVLQKTSQPVEQIKQPLNPVICVCNTTPNEIEKKKGDTPKTIDSGKKSSEKPPKEKKQGCSGSDNNITEKKNTNSTKFRRPGPERSYLDI